jgi:hypothetical protein
MRQPASPLDILLAAIPDEALRPLVLALVTNGSAAPRAPLADPPPPPAAKRAGWPKGRKRGRVRPSAAAATTDTGKIIDDMAGKAGAAAEAKRLRVNARLREWRHRRAAEQRAAKRQATEERAAADAARASSVAIVKPGNGADNSAGNSHPPDRAGTGITPAVFWAQATALSSGGRQPWKTVARRLGLNEALCIDHYRTHTLPPIDAGAIEQFLQLPTPATP